MEHKNKVFVLDTNVILHDYKSILAFEENDVVLPIVVLEELDKFKKGNDNINFHAREFMRELDRIAGEKLFTEGISLGEGKGLLFIETGKSFSQEMEKSFAEDTPDHRILAITDYLRYKYRDRPVILVTQDINLRMKAKSLGLVAQEFKTGQVRNVENLYKGFRTFDSIDDDIINKLYQDNSHIKPADLELSFKLEKNQYFIMKGNTASALAYNNPETGFIERVEKRTAYGITPRNAEQTFALHALLNPNIQLISITGKAGTGKTLLALAAAIEQRRDYQQIFLSRPIVALGNKDLGFLPGDASEKVGPYMQPLFDNLTVIKHRFSPQSKEYHKLDELLKEEKLVISPLAYIRGRSLSNIYFIVDEAQNLTPHEIKTIITRAGEGTKIVFTGDIYQIDSPYLDTKSNGLSYLTDKLKGQSIFAHVNLMKGERSALADLASDLL